MYNPFQLTDSKIIENKMPRDKIIFPNRLSSNTNYPVHNRTFIDRNFVNGRKTDEIKPVQNSYIQKYHLHDLQLENDNIAVFEQATVDRFYKDRLDSGYKIMERNMEQSHQSNNRMGLDRPSDTRNHKSLADQSNREPLRRVLGQVPTQNQ